MPERLITGVQTLIGSAIPGAERRSEMTEPASVPCTSKPATLRLYRSRVGSGVWRHPSRSVPIRDQQAGDALDREMQSLSVAGSWCDVEVARRLDWPRSPPLSFLRS